LMIDERRLMIGEGAEYDSDLRAWRSFSSISNLAHQSSIVFPSHSGDG
jgi:hypothetical protein